MAYQNRQKFVELIKEVISFFLLPLLVNDDKKFYKNFPQCTNCSRWAFDVFTLRKLHVRVLYMHKLQNLILGQQKWTLLLRLFMNKVNPVNLSYCWNVKVTQRTPIKRDKS